MKISKNTSHFKLQNGWCSFFVMVNECRSVTFSEGSTFRYSFLSNVLSNCNEFYSVIDIEYYEEYFKTTVKLLVP